MMMVVSLLLLQQTQFNANFRTNKNKDCPSDRTITVDKSVIYGKQFQEMLWIID